MLFTMPAPARTQKAQVKRSSNQRKLTSTLAELEEAKQASKRKHGSATKTTAGYEGYIRRGKVWLADLIRNLSTEHSFEHPKGCPTSLDNAKWDVADLGLAFEIKPNRSSPWALASFISHKCFENNLGESTAEGVHAAFKRYWDNS